jgi:hypothetical protein
MRRWKLLGAVARLTVLALVFTLGAILFSSPCTVLLPLDILDRIQAGMKKPDIEDIIGSPPGDYRTGPVVEIPNSTQATYWEEEHVDEWIGGGPDLRVYTWKTDRVELEIVFLKSGEVATAAFTRVSRQELGPLESLAWRAKRLWRKWFP